MTIAAFDNHSPSNRQIEEDKSLKYACRSRSASPAMSDLSDGALSHSSAVEADISSADCTDEGSSSETDKAHGYQGSKGRDQLRIARSGSDQSTSAGSNNSTPALTKEEAQMQLEKMSQAVMNAWSTLRALESELTTTGNGHADTPAVEITPEVEKPPSHHGTASLASTCLKCRGPIEHAESLLHIAKQTMDSTPGVLGTSIVVGNAGNLATFFIDMAPNAPVTTRLSVCAIAKAALLEAAASTEIVYVLGYEAVPFKEKDNGTGFAATLAIVPNDRQPVACWDTFTKGVCPRKSKCKWWHPGRDEIQPLQVIFR